MTRPTPPSTAQAPRSDGEAIDWGNVAAETTVMLRLQDVKRPVDKKAKPETEKGPG